MTPKTKKRLLIAGGVVGAITAIGVGVAVAKSSGSSENTSAPPATDNDISKVVDYALAHETDPAVLRQLATAMMVLPYANPLHNKIGALQARATTLELAHQVVQGDSSATQHVGNF